MTLLEKRKKANRWKTRRKSFRILYLFASAVLLLSALKVFFHAPYFQIREIRWEGIQRTDPKELEERFRDLLGQNLISLDLSSVHSRLLSHRWIKAATIRKIFPDRIEAHITERVPAAIEIDPLRNEFILRDREGAVLEREQELSAKMTLLPRVVSYNDSAYKSARELLRLLSARPDAVLDLSRSDDLIVHLPEGLVHLGHRDYAKRWTQFVQVEAASEFPAGTSWEADLRFPSKVVVKTSGGSVGSDEGSAHSP